MALKYGKLRHKVNVQQPVDSVTAKGDNEITYVTTGQAFASIEPLAGRELLFAKQIRADLSHKITLHWRREYTHRTRLAWNDGVTVRYFNLGPPVSQELRNVQIEVYATEII